MLFLVTCMADRDSSSATVAVSRRPSPRVGAWPPAMCTRVRKGANRSAPGARLSPTERADRCRTCERRRRVRPRPHVRDNLTTASGGTQTSLGCRALPSSAALGTRERRTAKSFSNLREGVVKCEGGTPWVLRRPGCPADIIRDALRRATSTDAWKYCTAL